MSKLNNSVPVLEEWLTLEQLLQRATKTLYTHGFLTRYESEKIIKRIQNRKVKEVKNENR